MASLVVKTEAALGPISILVNNAGVGGFGPAHEKSEEDWDRVLNTNLKSVFLVSRAVAPSMIRAGRGDIINISSLAGRKQVHGQRIFQGFHHMRRVRGNDDYVTGAKYVLLTRDDEAQGAALQHTHLLVGMAVRGDDRALAQADA